MRRLTLSVLMLSFCSGASAQKPIVLEHFHCPARMPTPTAFYIMSRAETLRSPLLSLFNDRNLPSAKRACRRGDPSACTFRGWCSLFGRCGEQQDLERALHQLFLACSAEDALGCTLLAVAENCFGLRSKKTISTAGLLEQSCRTGESTACLALAWRPEGGICRVDALDEAVMKLYQQACQNERGWACSRLGQHHLPNDATRAEHYFYLGCTMGSASSCARLHMLYQRELERLTAAQVEVPERLERDLKQLDAMSRRFELSERALRDASIKQLERSKGDEALHVLASLYEERALLEYLIVLEAHDKKLEAHFTSGSTVGMALTPPQPDFHEAIALYERVADVGSYPARDEVLYALGYLHGEQYDDERATLYYQRLVKDHPDSRLSGEVYFRLGDYAFDTHDHLEDAVPYYRSSIALKGDLYYDKALYKLAWTFYRLDRFDEAIAAFLRVAEHYTQSGVKSESGFDEEAKSYLAIILADSEEGSLERTKEVLGPLSDRPYTEAVWHRYIEVLYDMTRFDEAVAAAKHVMKTDPLSPENPALQELVYRAYERLRLFEQASSARRAMISRFGVGSVWFAAQTDAVVVATSERVKQALAAEAIFWHQIAQQKRKKKEEALNAYLRAASSYADYLQRFPTAEDAYTFELYLAEAYFYTQNYTRALEHYENVRDADKTELMKEAKEGIRYVRQALGFGAVNNDDMMEAVTNAGNGIYAVISSEDQAINYVNRRLLNTFNQIAKDVKIQVELNPNQVLAYRLLGYENRAIADEDFTRDNVDAGEIGSGHTVTALYELVLTGGTIPEPEGGPAVIDGAATEIETDLPGSGKICRVRIRYKDPAASADEPASQIEQALVHNDIVLNLQTANIDMRWAAAVASLAEILKGSPYARPEVLGTLETIFSTSAGNDPDRQELVELFRTTRSLLGQ